MNSWGKTVLVLGAALLASSAVLSGDVLPFVAATILALKAAQSSFTYKPAPAVIRRRVGSRERRISESDSKHV